MCQVLVTMTGTDPRAAFRHARRTHFLVRARRRLIARQPGRTRPRDLGDIAGLSWRAPRLQVIPLEAIVGTVDATADFDAGFRPATDRVAARWESVARAHRQRRSLQPISLLERPDGYYVLDGRHRVSVARALGHADIDAWTSPAGPTASTPPPINPERPMPNLTHSLRAALTNALREVHTDERVHFHTGDHGRAYVCENPSCSSPGIATAG